MSLKINTSTMYNKVVQEAPWTCISIGHGEMRTEAVGADGAWEVAAAEAAMGTCSVAAGNAYGGCRPCCSRVASRAALRTRVIRGHQACRGVQGDEIEYGETPARTDAGVWYGL